MAVNSTSNIGGTYSSLFRMTGLASGLDTDSIIKSLMKAESAPLNKLEQKKQLAEWKTTAYRDITKSLMALKSDYFNNAKMSTNLLSESALKKYSATSSTASIVIAQATGDATAGNRQIEVRNLAAAEAAKSNAGVSKTIQSSNTVNVSGVAGKSFTLNLDGNAQTITISGTVTNTEDLKTNIQSSVNAAFGENKITVDIDGTGKISFATNANSGVTKLLIYSGPSETRDAFSQLGFNSGSITSNRLNVNQTLASLASNMTNLTVNSSGNVDLTINGQNFKFSSATTLKSMMDQINSNSDAGVTVSYNELTDKISITSKQTGAQKTLNISENGSSFLQAANIFDNSGAYLADSHSDGQDAEVIYDSNITIKRSSNNISIDGVNYTLLKKSADGVAETVTVKQDEDTIFNNIKGFVDKYNDLVTQINTRLTEKYDRDYQPLTSDQKSTMKEDEITKWETKAKTGLLKSDSILQKIVSDMRTALVDKVPGTDISLSSIGITTGDWQDKGKLTIDETKLRAAIQNKPEEISKLFSTKSDITTNIDLTEDQRKERYQNEGLAYRIFDVVENNIRTIRDKDGKVGTLLEKAGIEGHLTEFKSSLYNEISDYTTRISDMTDRLADKETALYNKYAALEQYISQMNSQSSWLTSQFNSGS